MYSIIALALMMIGLSVSEDVVARKSTEDFMFESASKGKIAPLIPDEFVTNFMAHKWRQNGFRHNEVITGTIWNSFKSNMLRADIAAYDWDGMQRMGGVIMITMDFGKSDGQVFNTMYTRTDMSSGQCTHFNQSTEQSLAIILPKQFLRTNNASFIGQTHSNDNGLSDKWLVMINKIPVTFYFDSDDHLYRVDYTDVTAQQTAVIEFFNMDSSAAIGDKIFAGSGACKL